MRVRAVFKDESGRLMQPHEVRAGMVIAETYYYIGRDDQTLRLVLTEQSKLAYLHVTRPIRRGDTITVDMPSGRVTVRRRGWLARLARAVRDV